MISVLFACTGNTCRSPIAAAIARQYVKLHNMPFKISSAGLHADSNCPITPEAHLSLQNIGIDTVHASQPLTPELIGSSDAIFVMENWQAEKVIDQVRQMALATPPVVMMIDPMGDIADPLGKGQSAYDNLTKQMLGLVPGVLSGLAKSPAAAEG